MVHLVVPNGFGVVYLMLLLPTHTSRQISMACLGTEMYPMRIASCTMADNIPAEAKGDAAASPFQ